METKTKIMLGLVGAGVAVAVIYMMTRKRTVMLPAAIGVAPSVPVINYSNSKPLMGLNAFSDRAKPVMGGQNLQSQSDQMNPKNSVLKQKMGA